MTEQQTQPQELTVEQHLDQLTKQYIRHSIEQSFSLRGGNLEKFDEFWGLINPGIQLGEDHSVSIHGKPASDYVQALVVLFRKG